MIKKFKFETDQDKMDPYDVIIWNNSEIKIAKKPVFYKSGTRQVFRMLNTS